MDKGAEGPSPVLPGDHGAGLGLAGRGGGGAELGEAAVTRLQAGHGAPEVGDRGQQREWGRTNYYC